MEADPDHKKIYQKNTESFIAELNDLNRAIEFQLKSLEPRTFLTFHPSWGYFAQAFGLNQISIEQSGKEPSPRQLMQIIQVAQENRIRTVFVSPQSSQKSAEMIAREINGTVKTVDPLAEDYMNNLRDVADAIAGKSR